MADRAGAVSTYHHCASVLEPELSVEPDISTYRAFQRPISQARPPLTAGALSSRLSTADTLLFGRAGELAVLQQTWAAAATGRSGLALIRGGAGVGKTRLVAEIAALARQQDREQCPVRPVQARATRLPPLQYGELVAQDQDLGDPPRLPAPGQPQPCSGSCDQEKDEPPST